MSNESVKPQRLTLKQQEFVKRVIKDKNLTKAAAEVYDLGSKGGKNPYNTAKSIGSDNLAKPYLRASIQQQLETMGIDRREILKQFKKLLYSTDQRVCYQAIDMYLKITGGYAPEKKMLLEKSEIYSEIRELPEEDSQEA